MASEEYIIENFILSASDIAQEDFLQTIIGLDDHPTGTDSWYQSWAEGRAPHLCRILNIFNKAAKTAGPTLDIGSEGGCFFRAIKKFRPDLLPYSCADLDGTNRVVDGETIVRHKYHCEKDRLPLEDQTIGVAIFCDVIEHLLVDPIWALLEINRVLRMGGHLIVSTPNVAGIHRAVRILKGYHPCDEHHYTPTFIGARHNREWTPSEVMKCLQELGFALVIWDTNKAAIPQEQQQFLNELRRLGIVEHDDNYFGPDLVAVFQKTAHYTLESDLTIDQRWPSYLYTGYDCFRRRPNNFPVLVTRDY